MFVEFCPRWLSGFVHCRGGWPKASVGAYPAKPTRPKALQGTSLAFSTRQFFFFLLGQVPSREPTRPCLLSQGLLREATQPCLLGQGLPEAFGQNRRRFHWPEVVFVDLIVTMNVLVGPRSCPWIFDRDRGCSSWSCPWTLDRDQRCSIWSCTWILIHDQGCTSWFEVVYVDI